MIYIPSTFRNSLHTIFYLILPVLRVDKIDKMREMTHLKKIISDIGGKENCEIRVLCIIKRFLKGKI